MEGSRNYLELKCSLQLVYQGAVPECMHIAKFERELSSLVKAYLELKCSLQLVYQGAMAECMHT